MTVEEYRQRMMRAFHNTDTDELVALCVLPTEKDFEDLEWFLKNHYKNEPCGKTGRWSRKTKVDAYDIAGVKTWGIKCQCDRCDFTTIVVEDFGYQNYCPNCGARMIESQESEDKE